MTTFEQRKEARTANSRLPQWGVIPLGRDRQWLIEHSTSHQSRKLSGWCFDSIVLRNPPLRQAPKTVVVIMDITKDNEI